MVSFVSNPVSAQSVQPKALPGRIFTALVAIPASIALLVSGYLAYIALTSSSVAGCSGGVFDCNSVLNTKWSKWLGIPVSFLAASTYVALLGSLIMAQRGNERSRRFFWAAVLLLSLSAGIAAVWFTQLQYFWLGHLCMYCLTAHACGLFLAVLFLIRNPFGWAFTGQLASCALAGWIVLAGGQAMTPAPKTYKIIQYESPTVSTHDMPSSDAGDQGIFAPAEQPDSMDLNSSPGLEDSDSGIDGLFDAPVEPTESLDTVSSPSNASVPPQAAFETRYQPVSMSIMSSLLMTSLVAYAPQDPQVADDPAKSAAATENAAAAEESAAPQRRLATISGGTIKLDVKQWPLCGSPDAKYVFVEMFDYACPHCRHTHENAIKGAREKLGNDVAIVALPLPLNTACNNAITQTGALFGESCEIAKLAVAVWRVDHEKFTEFHNWMFEGPYAPNFATAKAKAETLVDPQALAKELSGTVCGAYLGKHVEIYKRVGRGDVPKLMFPTTSIVGEFGSADALADLIKQHCANQ